MQGAMPRLPFSIYRGNAGVAHHLGQLRRCTLQAMICNDYRIFPGVGAVLNRFSQSFALEPAAGLDQLTKERQREGRHEKSAQVLAVNETFRRQAVQRLADGVGADGIAACDLLDLQLFARRQQAIHDVPFQGMVDGRCRRLPVWPLVTQCVLQFRLYDYSASYGSARFIDAGHACPMPEGEPAFHPDNGPKQKITEQAEIKDKREDPGRLKLRGGDTDQLAKPFAASKELGRDGAGHDADRADLE